jgi:hypothetical protein
VRFPTVPGAFVRLRTAADREPTNTQPRVVKDDDASVFQRLFNCRQLASSSSACRSGLRFRTLPEQDQRGSRLGPQCQQGGKIGVG